MLAKFKFDPFDREVSHSTDRQLEVVNINDEIVEKNIVEFARVKRNAFKQLL